MKQPGNRRVCLVLGVQLLCLSGCGRAEEIAGIAVSNPKDIDPWAYLKNTDISSNRIIREFAGSAAELLITIGVMGIVFSVFYMVFRLFWGSNKAKIKNEVKEEAAFKALIAMMLFSIPFWLGLMKMLSDLLVG